MESIQIRVSKTADSRTTDHVPTEKELFESSIQHILDVKKGLEFFIQQLHEISEFHDRTKITYIHDFYNVYMKGLEDPDYDWHDNAWYNLHVTQERHHLNDHVPEDVNLLDVLERISDIVMAGMGRSGSVKPDMLDAEILQKAYANTIKLLANEVQIIPDDN